MAVKFSLKKGPCAHHLVSIVECLGTKGSPCRAFGFETVWFCICAYLSEGNFPAGKSHSLLLCPPYTIRFTLEMGKLDFSISKLNLIVLLTGMPLVKLKIHPIDSSYSPNYG